MKFRCIVFREFRLVTASLCVPVAAVAAFREEVAQDFRGLFPEEAAVGEDGVVEACVGGGVVEGAGVSGFGVSGGEDEAAYSSGVKRAGAHGAGFQGGVEGAVGEPPGAEAFGGAAEGEYLGVGGWIPGSFAFVGGDGDYLSVAGDYGAYRDFAVGGGFGGGGQGAAHHGNVLVGGCFIGAKLKFSFHRADNSRVLVDVIERGPVEVSRRWALPGLGVSCAAA